VNLDSDKGFLVAVVKVATFGVWRRDKIPEFGKKLNGGSGIGANCLLCFTLYFTENSY
jgi:hypothetical protein